MPPAALKFFNPAGPDRVALLWAEPVQGKAATGASLTYLLRLARGPRTGKLSKTTAYGPYPEHELPQHFAELSVVLRTEGFLRSGMHSMLQGLGDPSPARRGKSALRLGWSGDREAVPALLAALPPAVDEVCPILDALGMLGDPRAVPAVRPYAARKLLSRRRSAVEALRNLGDAEGLAEARQRTLEQLPQSVRDALAAADALQDVAAIRREAAKVVEAVLATDAQRHGLALDTLYELATPASTEAARLLLGQLKFDRPFVWRYVKSVLKRATLRHDYLTFGRIVHDIEAQGRQTPGTTAVLKSGYDGVERSTPVFRRKTRDYLRRAGWRYLRNLAKSRPERYPFAAAAAMIPYTPQDEAQVSKGYGALSGCYLLHRILFGGSPRYELRSGTMRFRLRKGKSAVAPPNTREEAYPHLWDAQPAAYLRLMGAAKLIDVQRFAYDAIVTRHREALHAATDEQVLLMLDAPFQPTVALALAELERRFNPDKPNWPLLLRLASESRPDARDLAHRLLRQTAATWTHDPDRIAAFLTAKEPTTRALVADLVIAPLRARPGVRQALAPRLLALLRGAAPVAEDAFDAIARVCREALADELDALLSSDELLEMITSPVPAVQAVAADLLGRRPEAVGRLGIARITEMAQHPLAAVRSAAAALLRSAAKSWQQDPSVLLVLAESEWPDTRQAALDLLDRYVAFDALGFDALVGLLDSNRPDVQERGRRLAVRNLSKIDPAALAERLAQHPHPEMRLFALDLVTRHLPDGAAALAKVELLCRSSLFDVWPRQDAKQLAVSFLLQRGMRDAEQARVASRLLGTFARTQGRRDGERVLDALIRLKLAYPEVESPLVLPPELLAPDPAPATAAGEGGVP